MSPVIATVGNGVLAPSDPGAVEEWLAFNASVRRAGERKGRLSFLSRSGLERGGDAGRGRGLRWGALERGGDHSAGSSGVRMGRTVYVGRVLSFFESFPFFQIGRSL